MNDTRPPSCPPESEIEEFAMGDLPDDAAEQLSQHIEECPQCEDTLDAIQNPADTLLNVLGEIETAPQYLDEPELDAGIDLLRDRTVVATGEQTRQSERNFAAPIEPPLDRSAELGSYRLLSKLGQGGMGAVYKAIHTELDKTVAIKVLAASRFGDRNSTNRFKREMKAIGRVQHPNVVVAHDGGQVGHEHFLVMEYVDGIDVSDLDRRHKGLPIQVACEIIRQAAIGLQHAHEQGLIHRDIKPSNLMLSQSGVVKVLDLGLARIETELSSVSGDRQDGPQDDGLTATGIAMGTIGYMPPEQALDSRQVDHLADLYSLAATLYKLLAGQLPFSSDEYDTNGKMLVAIATKQPPSIATVRPDLPPQLVNLVDRTLSKEPAERIQTASQFAQQLAPFAGISLVGLATTPAEKLPQFVAERAPEFKKSAAPQHSKPKTWGLVATAAIAVGLLLLAVQTFWVRTEYGTLKIEIADAQVEARLKTDGISVIDNANHKVWDIKASPTGAKSLPTGEYRFEAPDGLVVTDENGLEIATNEFKLLGKDQQLRIHVSMVSEPEPTSSPAAGGESSMADAGPSVRNGEQAARSMSVEDSLVQLVESLGGEVQRGGYGQATTVRSGKELLDKEGFVWLRFYKVHGLTDPSLQQVADAVRRCSKLRFHTILLSGTSITATGLLSLEGLGFERIDVQDSQNGLDVDDIADRLSRWPNYTWNLGNAISGQGLVKLAQSKRFRYLTLSCERISPAELSVLEDRPLSVFKPDIGDQDPAPYLSVLQRFSKCESIDLYGDVRPTDRQLSDLSRNLLGTKIYSRGELRFAPSLARNVRVIQDSSTSLYGDLQLTEAAPLDEYEIELDVQRQGTPDGFSLDLPIGNSSTRLTLGGWDGLCSVLSGTDIYVPGDPFADNAKHRVRVRVTTDSVKVWVDESSLMEWTGDSNQLGDPQQQGIWLRSDQRYELSNLRLAPHKEAFALPARQSPEGRNSPKVGDDLYARDREVARWVLSIGGKVAVGGRPIGLDDIDQSKFNVTRVDLKNTTFSQADLASLATLPALTHLEMVRAELDAEGMKHLCRCQNLRILVLGGARVRPEDLEQLAQLPELWNLTLSTEHVPSGWGLVGELPKLQTLNNWSYVIPNIEELGKHPNLRNLNVIAAAVTTQEIQKVIDQNPQITIRCSVPGGWHIYRGDAVPDAARQLWKDGWTLSGTFYSRVRPSGDLVPWNPTVPNAWDDGHVFKVSNAKPPKGHRLTAHDVQLLNCFGNLDRLKLMETSNVQILSESPLKYDNAFVDMHGSSLDDETLLAIGSQNPIRFLNLEDTNVTQAGIQAFKQLRPNCHVVSSFGDFPTEHRFRTAAP